MSFWRLHYHLVWTTKNRIPHIGVVEEQILSESFRLTFADLDVVPHAVGFMPDHVHIAVSIPPKIAISDVVRRLKGASSRAMNSDPRRLESSTFAWQDDYGALSFSDKGLDRVIEYVCNQPTVHANRQLIEVAELTAAPKPLQSTHTNPAPN
jgi:putative transposase